MSDIRPRSILDLTAEEAKTLLRPQSYCSFDLPNYFDFSALLDRAAALAQKGHVIRPARICRTALRIALRKLGPDHAYTMFIASGYGTFLVAAGQGPRARKIADQLYPKYSALGTENTDPWFGELRFELSRKGL